MPLLDVFRLPFAGRYSEHKSGSSRSRIEIWVFRRFGGVEGVGAKWEWLTEMGEGVATMEGSCSGCKRGDEMDG